MGSPVNVVLLSIEAFTPPNSPNSFLWQESETVGSKISFPRACISLIVLEHQ